MGRARRTFATDRDAIIGCVAIEDRGHTTRCWVWTGDRTTNGYGRHRFPERGRKRVHRVAYEILRGPIPDGLQIDHLCLTKLCCNPDHLEPVTGAENVARAVAAGLFGRHPDKCMRGHVFTFESTIIVPTGRRCRICRNEYQRNWAVQTGYDKRRRARHNEG